MGKKANVSHILVFLVGLVWPLATWGADPHLMGWWKLDGDGLDSSGNGRAGVLVRDAHFDTGHEGKAVAFDGDGDAFTVTGYKGVLSVSAVTVMAWVNTTAAGDRTMVYWGRNAGRRRVDFRLGAGRLRVEHGGGNLQGDTALNDGEWHHVALTMPPLAPISYPQVKLYLDGRDDTRNTQDPEGDFFELVANAANVDVTFGYRVPNADRYFEGRLDDVRMYDRELSAGEITDLAAYGYLANASSPSIPDEGKFEETWTSLEWVPGPLGAYRNVYFGTSFEDVNAGTGGTFLGKTTGNSQVIGVAGFPLPGGLVPGTTYYWRVEEVNEAHPDSPWHGQVWSFWLPQVAAYNPFPGDGEPCEDPNVDLSWAWGMKGVFGSVYFGTDANAVAGATGGPPTIATTHDPGLLEPGKTYYWRADTFNGTQWVTGKVWTFATMTPIALTADPNLVGWWTMDEGAGTRVLDRSGRSRHGRFQAGDSPTWVAGSEGTALSFDGLSSSGYVTITGYNGILGNNPFSITAWVKATDMGDRTIVCWGAGTAGQRADFRLYLGRLRLEHGNGNLQGSTALNDDEWHHVACAVNRDAMLQSPDVSFYLDGEEDTYLTSDPDKFNILGTFPVTIGRRCTHSDRPFWGTIDDVRLFDKVLTAPEVEAVLRVNPLRAWQPNPRNGATLDIRTLGSLAWAKGDNAAKHDVYFGTDAAAVAAADTADTSGIYRGRIGATSFTPAENLLWGQAYFWRVDEVGSDGTVAIGKVWSFRVAGYLVIEDFDDYTDADGERIYQTWVDGWTNGTGAVVGNLVAPFAERGIIYDGTQAMPMDYNNIKSPFYSEAERSFAPAQNWTLHGVDTLTLYICGVAANAAGPLYVGVQDNADQIARFVHPNPSVVQQIEWQRWDIPLADVTKAGANTRSIKKILVGVGDRNNPQPAGTGRIYVDAIRLTIAAPVQP
ncbi:MAG: LamG domain-containing protein [Planctomycetes bacterium]|nr:LamG domain-containing protein [Planctomycetota bacterium]